MTNARYCILLTICATHGNDNEVFYKKVAAHHIASLNDAGFPQKKQDLLILDGPTWFDLRRINLCGGVESGISTISTSSIGLFFLSSRHNCVLLYFILHESCHLALYWLRDAAILLTSSSRDRFRDGGKQPISLKLKRRLAMVV